MKTKTPPKTTNRQLIHNKTDYSHISSRLFSSMSKSKQKPSFFKQQQIVPKSIKLSIQKTEEIGEQKYKVAMRHMEKFKKYQQEVKKRKLHQNQKIDSQCTFKPKVNNNKKYNQQSRFMNTSFTQRYLNKSKQPNPQGDYLNQTVDNINRSKQKPKQQQSKPTKRLVGQKLADRLMNWGKNRDMKNISKTIEAQVSKNVSRGSSIQSISQRKSTIQKQKSYSKLHEKKFNLTLSSILNNKKDKSLTNSQTQGNQTSLTPRTERKYMKHMVRSTISLASNDNDSLYSSKRNELLDGLKFDKIDQNQVNEEKQLMMKKRLKFYTEITPSFDNYQTVGEQILSKQSNRGEGQFYLRQAKANINKNYQKTDLLVKNKQYSTNFAKQFTKILNLSNNK